MATRAPEQGSTIVVFADVGATIFWWRLDRTDFASGAMARSQIQDWGRELWQGGSPQELATLFEVLLQPALGTGTDERPLILIPDGIVAGIPFAALRNPATGRYLIESRTVSLRTSLHRAQAPILRPSGGPRRDRWRAVVVGDPAFDRETLSWLSRLPAADREARRVAASLGGDTALLLGEEATLAAVRSDLQGRQILHLAAHGLPGDTPFQDRFVLAAESSRYSSGLVSSGELLESADSLRLAVLSGCSTLGTTPSRSAGLLGLANSFVARGVSAVVATLWPMRDDLLEEMMTDFHRGLIEGLSASESLRQAQLRQASEGCCEWAGVQLIGDLPPVGAR